MTVSSMMPPSSFMISDRQPVPGSSPLMSPTTTVSMKSAASFPCHLIWPMCDTSNSPARSRVWKCSLSTPPLSDL
jgi:hypothetical protein